MNIPLQRLNRLSDLVFASAMTIMIFLLSMPEEGHLASKQAFQEYLRDSLPRLYLFLITFVIVDIYWVKDLDQFRHVNDTDNTHTWLQWGSLAFLVLLPWTNALMEINPDHVGVRIIYCVDIFFIGIFSGLAWRYASRGHRLIKKDLDDGLIKNIAKDSFSEPAIAVVAAVVAFAYLPLFDATFILIPLGFVVQLRIRQKLLRWMRANREDPLKEWNLPGSMVFPRAIILTCRLV